MGMNPTLADTPNTALTMVNGETVLEAWQHVESLGIALSGETAAALDQLTASEQPLTATGVVENGYRQWHLSLPTSGEETPQFARLRLEEY